MYTFVTPGWQVPTMKLAHEHFGSEKPAVKVPYITPAISDDPMTKESGITVFGCFFRVNHSVTAYCEASTKRDAIRISDITLYALKSKPLPVFQDGPTTAKPTMTPKCRAFEQRSNMESVLKRMS